MLDLLAMDADGVAMTLVAPRDTALFREAVARGIRVRALDGDIDRLTGWLTAAAFDVVHVHAGIGWEGHALTAAARASGAQVLRTEHLPWLLTEADDVAAYQRASETVDRVIAVSPSVAESYRLAEMSEDVIVTVANGVGAPKVTRDPAALRRELGLGDAPMLLHIGRFSSQKNHAVLLDAMRRLGGDAQLLLVGDGDLRSEIVRAIANGLAGRVRILGQRDDCAALIAAADLLLLPSKFEGLPLVALEAMALGTPIIATDAPGIRDALDDRSGWLVPVDDAQALADTIAAALNDAPARTARAEAARQRHADHFTADRMRQETRAVWTGLAKEPRRMTATRVGFIGAGGIARRHLGVLQTMDDVLVTAVTDVDADGARRFAEDTGARTFASAEELCASGEVDALWICVPPFAHGAPEDAAIAHRIPFFVEKPVAIDLPTAERIAAAVEAKGLITGVGYHWRYLDVLDDVAHAMGARKPRLASGYWLDSTPPPRWWWRREQSGGQMAEQATHLLDLARYLMGDVTRVYALEEHTHRDAFPDLDVATASTASLLFADGAIANLAATCLLGWNHRVGLHLFGEGFAAQITDRDAMIDVGHGRPVTPNRSDPVMREDRDFIDAVRGGENRIRCPYHEALATLRVADALDRSAREGRAIELASAASTTIAAAA